MVRVYLSWNYWVNFCKSKENYQDGCGSDLLNKAISFIKGEEEFPAIRMMFDFGRFNNIFAGEAADSFVLMLFLVVEQLKRKGEKYG